MRNRKRSLISRASLLAAAALLVSTPREARAANIFLDTNTTAIGTGASAAFTWDLITGQWINAGTATSIPGNAAATTIAVTTTSASGTSTGVIPYTGSTTGLAVGMSVTGTNVPANSVITAITPGTSITISTSITTAVASGTALTIGGYVFTSADTAYFTGQGGQTGTLSQAVTMNGIYDSTVGITIAGAQTLTLAGTSPTITTVGTTNTVISANLAGTSGFSKAGSGVLTLSGANTISGTIALQQGILSLGSATALGTASLTIGGYGLPVGLDASAATTLTSTNAQSWSSDFTFIGSNSLNLGAGAVTLLGNRALQVGMSTQFTGSLTVGGAISGAYAITKTGPGALILSGINTYTGGTVLSSGSLTLSGANTTTGATTLNGGRLYLGNASAVGSGALNLNGGLFDASGSAQTLTTSGGINLNGLVAFGSSYMLTSGSSVNLLSNSELRTMGTVGTVATASGGASGQAVINTGNTSSLYIGMPVYGTGIPTGAVITAITANTNFTISQNLTATASGSVLGVTPLTLSGVVAGTGFSLTKSGTGSLLLSAPNTFTGGVTMVDGRLIVGNSTALGTGTFNILGGSLDASLPGLNLANNITLSGNTLAYTGSYNATLSGNVAMATANPSITVGFNTLTLSGVVSGLGLTKNGPGTLVLSGGNTYSGGTTVRGGTLTAGNASAFGSGTVTIATGGTVDLANQAVGNNINLFGGTLANTGGTTNLVVSQLGATSFGTISGVLSGTGALSQSNWLNFNNAAQVLSLTAANTFSGGTTLSAGTVSLGNNAALGTGALTATGGILDASAPITITNVLNLSGVIGFLGTNSLAQNTGAITLQGNTSVYSGNGTAVSNTTTGGASGQNVITTANTTGLVVGQTVSGTGIPAGSVITAITPSTSYTISNNLTATVGTTVTAYNALQLNGVIGGNYGLTVNGPGLTVLGGANTLTGGVTVNSGILRISNNSALGTAALTINGNSSNSGTFDIAGKTITNNVIITGGSTTDTTGGAGAISNAIVTINNLTSNVTLSTNITGTSTLIKNGFGNVTASGVTSYTGGTIINGGTVTLGTNSGLGNGSITVNGGGTLDVATYTPSGALVLTGGTLAATGGTTNLTAAQISATDYGTISGIISGTSLTVNTGGYNNQLTLSGANTFSGGLTLTSGVLRLGNNAAAGTGLLTLNGGTLDATSALTITNALSLAADTTYIGTNNLTQTTGAIGLTANRAITVQANQLSLGGIVSGAYSLTKNGFGTLQLIGANTYSGGTVINQGTLDITGGNVAALGTGGVTVNPFGTLSLGAVTPTNTITLAGGAVSGSAVPVSILASSSYGLVSGVLAGTGNLNVNTTGALNLYNANTFTASTGATTGANTVGTAVIPYTATTGLFVGMPVSGTNVPAGSYIASIQAGTSITLNQNTTTAVASATTLTFGSVLTAGTLNLWNATSLGAAAVNWTIKGGTLDNTTTAAITAANPLTIAGNFAFQGTQPLTFSGQATLTAPTTITTNAVNLTFGWVSGSYGLTKAGPGLMTLNGNNGFNALTVNAGTVDTGAASSANTLYLGSGTVTIASGANVLFRPTYTADLTITNALAGAGNFYLTPRGNGTSATTLSGSLAGFTGLLDINANGGGGKVAISAPSAGALVRIESQATQYITAGTYTNTFQLLGGTTGESYGQLRLDAGTVSGNVILLANTTVGSANTGGTISGQIVGNYSLTRQGSGTSGFFISGNNTFTGGLNVVAGTTTLGSATAAGTGTLNLSVSSTTSVAEATGVTTLTLGGLAGVAGTTLNTTNAGSTAVAVTVGANNANTTFAGVISGTGSITKVGTGTLTLQGLNTYTGGTTVNAGGLTVDFTTNATNVLASTGSLTLGGGTLTLNGKSAATDAQTLAGLTLSQGGNTIAFTQNSATGLALKAGALTRSSNATINIVQSATASATNGLIVTNSNTNGILGGWAVYNGADFAVANAASGVNAYTGYATLVGDGTDAATANVLVTTAPTITSTTGVSINTLKLAPATSGQTLDLAGQVLTLNAGGLLFTGTNAFTLTSSVAGGALTSGANAQLIVHQYGTGAGVLTIAAPITDTAVPSALSLVKAGPGQLILTGVNTYTGNTSIYGGTLTIGADSALGTAPGSFTANNLTLSGGTLNSTSNTSLNVNRGITLLPAGGTLAPTSGSTMTVPGAVTGSGALTVTGSSNGTLQLQSANTYTGGTNLTAGTLQAGNATALGTGPVTQTGGTLNFGAGVTTATVSQFSNTSAGTVTLSTSDATPLATTLSITNTTGVNATLAGTFNGLGTVALAGNGATYTLSGNNSNTGGFTLAANSGLVIGNLGALGGALSIGAGSPVTGYTTTLDFVPTPTNPGTLTTNPVQTWAGDFTFLGTQNLDLGTGAVTLTSNRIITVNGSPTEALGTGILTVDGIVGGTANLTKAGSGRLVLTGANTFTGNITVTGGTLAITSNAALGNAANTVTLNGATVATASSSNILPASLAIAGTFSSARTINLSGVYNTIEVSLGNTFTPTAVFGIGNAASSTLVKTGEGTLVLGTAGQFTGVGSITAANGTNAQTQLGGVRVDQGTLQITNASALAANTVLAVNNAYNATVALSGGISIPNTVYIDNQAVGAPYMGSVALTSLSGSNTVTGAVISNLDASIGVADGATLNLTGGLNISGHVLGLVTPGAGVINISGAPITSIYGWSKIGTGTVNVATTMAANGGGSAVIYQGTVALTGAAGALATGSTQNIKLYGSGRLLLDNSTTFLANRLGGTNSINFNGGTFEYAANATMFSTETTTGALGIANEAYDNFIVDTTNAGSLLTFASLNTVTNGTQLIFRANGTGAAFGSPQNRVVFGTNPTLYLNNTPTGSSYSNVTGNGGIPGIIAPSGNAYIIDANGVNAATYNTTGFITGTNTAGLQAYQAYNNAPIVSTSTAGSAVVTLASTYGLAAGMPVNGPGIPAGTTIAAVLSPTQVQLSAAATSSQSSIYFQYQYSDVNSLAATSYELLRLGTGGITTNLTNILTRSSTGALINSTTPTTIDGAGLTTLYVAGGGFIAAGGTVANPVTQTLGANLVLKFTASPQTLSIAVNDNTTLNVLGSLSSPGNFAKDLGGTLIFSAPQWGLTGTNFIDVDAGTLQLNAGINTIYPNTKGIAVSPGATLDLNGNSQFLGNLTGPYNVGLIYTGGIITNTSATPANFIVNQASGSYLYFGGSITGNLSFEKSGGSNLNLSNAQTYTGNTVVNQNVLILRDNAALVNTSAIAVTGAELRLDNQSGIANNNNRLPDNATITLNAGQLTMYGRVATTSTETVGPVVLAGGLSNIYLTAPTVTGLTTVSNVTQLTMASLTRSSTDAMTNFGPNTTLGTTANNGTNIFITSAPTLTNNLIGAWAAVGGTDLATYVPGRGVVALSATNLGAAGYDGTTVVGATAT